MAIVSVVVPIYNVEKYLRVLIESLVNQTLRDLEIILVDDGSPDSSGAICDEYAAKDDRIKVIHKVNGGVGAARNDGLKIATGDWIIFCDSDDWLEIDALENLVNAAETVGADVAIGDANLVYGANVKKNQLYRAPFVAEDRESIDQVIAAVLSRNYCANPPEGGPGTGGYGGPWNKLIKRQLIVDNEISFDVRVKGHFDDILYVVHAYACASKIVYIGKPVYNYRQLNNSIAHSTAYKSTLPEINDAIFCSLKEFMAKYGSDGRYMKPYYANVIRRFESTIGPYFFNKGNPKSFKDQCKELREIMDREPYVSAIRDADPEKLHNRYHVHLWNAARKHSPVRVYLVFVLRKIKASIRKIKSKQ